MTGPEPPAASLDGGGRGSDGPAAVVVGLDSTTGLQTARVLARRGVPVVGVAADRSHPCCRTRVCREIVVADTSGPALVPALVELGRRLPEPAVLYPCSDLSVLALARGRDALAPWFHVVLPETDVIEMLVDKARFSTWAESEGIPVPRTRRLRDRADVEAAAAALRFPCILKPAVRTGKWKGHTREKGFRVEDADALATLFERCGGWADELVVQELVEGDDTRHVTCNCYITAQGEAAATFTSRKLRQWPITAGEGCLSEETREDGVRDATVRLFRAAGHRGLGYVEFKQHPRTGEYLVLEPNVGRPTGRSAQADVSGVELLLTQYRDALGLPLPEAPDRRGAGVKWIHFRRDLLSALHRWRRGELTLREWLRSWRGPKTDALFSWRDPAPFVADLLHCARRALAPRRDAPSRARGERPVPVGTATP